MIMKLYDSNMNYLCAITEYSGLKVSEELSLGYKTLSFNLPYSLIVKEEMRILYDDYLYCIKEINMRKKDMYEVFCKPDFGKLNSKYINFLQVSSLALDDLLNYVLTDTDWTYELVDGITGVFSVDVSRMTLVKFLTRIQEFYQVDVRIDTFNKKIICYKKRGKHFVSLLVNNSNILECTSQTNTYDLVTHLIPIGNYGIGLLNPDYVENHSYTDETIVGYFVDTSINSREDLRQVAEAKLEQICRPQTSYKVKTTQFDSQLQCGDLVRIIDTIRGIDTVKRIHKSVIEVGRPDRSYYEIGDTSADFAKIYKDFKQVQDIVNNTTISNFKELVSDPSDSESNSYRLDSLSSSMRVDLESESEREEEN